MSQHNIIGSEAFNRTPPLVIRKVRTGSMRRRQARTALAFVAGAVVALGGGLIAAALAIGPTLAG